MSNSNSTASISEGNCYSVHVCDENCDKHEYLEPIRSTQSEPSTKCHNIYYEIDLPRSSDSLTSDDVFASTLPYDVRNPPTLPPRPMMTSQRVRENSYFPDDVTMRYFGRQSVSKDLLLRNCKLLSKYIHFIFLARRV